MATQEWTIERDGRELRVQLEHDPAASFLDVRVNARSVVVRPTRNVDGSTLYRFTVLGEPAAITVRPSAGQYSYDFEIAGSQSDRTPSASQAAVPGMVPAPGASLALAPEATPLRSLGERTPLHPSFEATPLRPAFGEEVPTTGPKAPRISAAFVVALLVIVGLGGVVAFVLHRQSLWTTYQQGALGFEVSFPPGEIAFLKDQPLVKLGAPTQGAESVQMAADGARWTVDVLSASDELDQETLFQHALESLGAKNMITRSDRLQGLPMPGLDVEMMTPTGLVALRLLVADQRVYALHVSSVLAVRSDLRQRFFDSFRVLGDVAPTTR